MTQVKWVGEWHCLDQNFVIITACAGGSRWSARPTGSRKSCIGEGELREADLEVSAPQAPALRLSASIEECPCSRAILDG
jgi:hypothetical protein